MKEKIIKLLLSKNYEDKGIANELIKAHGIDIDPSELGLVCLDMFIGGASDQYYQPETGDIYLREKDKTWYLLSTAYGEFDL